MLHKIKAFSKWYVEGTGALGPKPETKGAEKKAAEAPETKVVQSRKTGPAGGKPGCWGISSDYHQLNLSTHSSRTGALGVIGFSGRARQVE